jgi:hypothetical protein
MNTPELVIIMPHMTVAEIAELCERHNAYVRIESTAGKPYAYLEPYKDDEHIPEFLRRKAG